jgi:hypothetical protein
VVLFFLLLSSKHLLSGARGLAVTAPKGLVGRCSARFRRRAWSCARGEAELLSAKRSWSIFPYQQYFSEFLFIIRALKYF